MQRRRNTYPAFREASIILILSLMIAVAFNALRPAGIPLFGFSSPELIKKQQANIPLIALNEAQKLYLKKKVVFVDARDPLSFEEGHIAGCYVRGASLLSAGLCLTFAAVLTISLLRGLHISCGCFGRATGTINWLYLVLDNGLAAMSVFTLIFDRGWRYFSLRSQ